MSSVITMKPIIKKEVNIESHKRAKLNKELDDEVKILVKRKSL